MWFIIFFELTAYNFQQFFKLILLHDLFNPFWKWATYNMRSKPKKAYINFSGFGHGGYLPISMFEMELLLRGAEQMLEQYKAEAAQEVMDRLAHELWLQALDHEITETWITKAVMLIAMRGLTGHEIPDIIFSST